MSWEYWLMCLGLLGLLALDFGWDRIRNSIALWVVRGFFVAHWTRWLCFARGHDVDCTIPLSYHCRRCGRPF